jgi:diaminopimelate decarboxylase
VYFPLFTTVSIPVAFEYSQTGHDMKFAESIHYSDGCLYSASVQLAEIAREVGTPVWVYDLDAVLQRYERYRDSFSGLRHQTCYAVKANSSLALLQSLARAGCGFDVNSRGELYRCMKAGADPGSIIMTGVGKTRDEIAYALDCGIAFFNVESASECRLISDIASEREITADILLRLNPDIEVETHPYISTGEASHKFGLSPSDIRTLASQEGWLPGLRIAGLSFHLGSQIASIEPYRDALRILLKVLDDITPLLPEAPLVVDIGGGFAIAYHDEQPELPPGDIADMLKDVLGPRAANLHIISEPGRCLVANAGVLLTSVTHIKPSSAHTSFLILDAGMNDLMRTALYGAAHHIIPLELDNGSETQRFDIVGPVCESSDTFATAYPLPSSIDRGDALAILSAGAYGASMSSTYNSRPLAAEVIVLGEHWKVSRERQSFNAMVADERLPEE